MNKILYFFSWLTISLSILAIITISIWLVYPYNVLEFNNAPIQVKEKTVKAGEHISAEVQFCKNTDKNSLLTISFIDGFIYNTQPVVSSFEKGCHNIIYFLYVPKAIPEGKYNIKATFRYRVNPVRDVDVVLITEPFEVVK